MKAFRPAAAVLAVVVFAGVAYVAQLGGATGPQMADAANKFLATLSAEQKAKTTFAFDNAERLKWAFVPLQDRDKKPTRKGVRLEELSAGQRDAALALLRAGTSAAGYTAATTIMSLESILRDLERNGTNVRDPGWYFVSVFGTPGASGKWGWRIEGHHLSLNYTVENNRVVSATPCFFGANPATVMAGDRKGTRAIPDVDDLAKELFTSLDADQKKLAEQARHFDEPNAPNPAVKVGEPVGIPTAKLTDKQRGTLMKLIQAYTSRLPDEIATTELARINQAGVDKIHFAYSGGTEQGKEHTYRLQGPTFVAEFLNRQADSARNPANHIHSAWRHIPKDFGLSGE
jgi:hypothetical protein